MRKPQSFGKKRNRVPVNAVVNRKFPQLKTAQDLIRFLLAEQQRAYGNTILEKLPYPAIQKNFSILLKEYSIEELTQAIVLSVKLGNNPGSTKFVKECAEWQKDSSYPHLNQFEKTTMPNKS